MPVLGEHYWQDEEGLWVENVGPWAKEKLKILTDYIQISALQKNIRTALLWMCSVDLENQKSEVQSN